MNPVTLWFCGFVLLVWSLTWAFIAWRYRKLWKKRAAEEKARAEQRDREFQEREEKRALQRSALLRREPPAPVGWDMESKSKSRAQQSDDQPSTAPISSEWIESRSSSLHSPSVSSSYHGGGGTFDGGGASGDWGGSSSSASSSDSCSSSSSDSSSSSSDSGSSCSGSD